MYSKSDCEFFHDHYPCTETSYHYDPDIAVDFPDEKWDLYKSLKVKISELEQEMWDLFSPVEKAYYEKIRKEKEDAAWLASEPERLAAAEAERLRQEERKRKAAERKALGDAAIDPKYLTPEALEKRKQRALKKLTCEICGAPGTTFCDEHFGEGWQ